MKSKGLICCILIISLFCTCFAKTVNLTMMVGGNISIANTDDNFICATVDWWPKSKCDFDQCPWGGSSILNLDLRNKILANAIKAFSSLRLRLGGTLQDKVVYKVGRLPKYCRDFRYPVDGLFNYTEGCLDRGRWDRLNKLFNESRALITFGLNALSGRKMSKNGDILRTGNWDPKNALHFMNYTASKGYKIDSYEFGNEISGDGVGAKVDAKQYGKDIIVLKKLIQELYPEPTKRPKVLGPGGFYDFRWYNTFLQTSGRNVVDGLTYHVYNLGSGDDSTIIHKVQDPNVLDQIGEAYFSISTSVNSIWPWTRAWVSESGGAYRSGSKIVSHTFANGFWYLDQLGMASKNNHAVFCRQSLIGGNYGLLDSTTFIPKPDYYGALLWHRLMGKKVLAAFHYSTKYVPRNLRKYLRAYAHCSKNTVAGDVSVVMINLSNLTTFEVQVHGYKDVNDREEYHLTPQGGNILSEVLLLNGKQLRLTQTSDIPKLNPKLVSAKSPIKIAPHSVMFATLKGFEAKACA